MNSLLSGTKIILIRHGEAVVNVKEIIGGHEGCEGLTSQGLEQAELLAARIAKTGEFDDAVAIYTSILPRAIETAEVLSGVLNNLLLIKTCSLCERHPGEADGLSWAEYKERYSGNFMEGKNMEQPLAPGGESYSDFLDRVESILHDIEAKHRGDKVVIVSHGGVIESSLIRLLGIKNTDNMAIFHPRHTSVTEWNATGSRWELQRYNDAAHLL